MRSTACTREPSAIFSARNRALSHRKKHPEQSSDSSETGKDREPSSGSSKEETVPVPAAASAKKDTSVFFFFAISSSAHRYSLSHSSPALFTICGSSWSILIFFCPFLLRRRRTGSRFCPPWGFRRLFLPPFLLKRFFSCSFSLYRGR